MYPFSTRLVRFGRVKCCHRCRNGAVFRMKIIFILKLKLLKFIMQMNRRVVPKIKKKSSRIVANDCYKITDNVRAAQRRCASTSNAVGAALDALTGLGSAHLLEALMPRPQRLLQFFPGWLWRTS